MIIIIYFRGELLTDIDSQRSAARRSAARGRVVFGGCVRSRSNREDGSPRISRPGKDALLSPPPRAPPRCVHALYYPFIFHSFI